MDLSSYLDAFGRRDWQRGAEGIVRFAMVGVGWWTRERALPAVEATERCETRVLVSGDPQKSRAVADRTPTAERGLTYGEFHDGEAADAYDAVYVSTPNATHLEYVETAADLGKHVLCEKPMEVSVERAASMVGACDAADVDLMVGYRMQTEPAIRRARALVRDGFVGDPTHVLGHMTQRLLEMIPDPDQWRLDPALVGPGTSVTDLGIYPLNTARFVLDEDPVAVGALMRSPSDAFASVPDEVATFEVEFDDGTLAACGASQNAHRSGRFEVVGREGRIALAPAFFGDDRRTLLVERGEASAEVAFDTVDQMVEEFAYFADRILGGGDVEPDGEHGLVDVQAIEAIYRAARGERVTL